MIRNAINVTAFFLAFLIHLPAFAINVPGSSDPWLAGMPDGSQASSGDVAPAQSPVSVSVSNLMEGSSITVTVTGQVSNGVGVPYDGPDGGALTPHGTGTENGISDVTAPVNSLIGVFLDDNQPDSTAAPAPLDFSSVNSRNFSTLSPSLKQAFFIGDGRNDLSHVQEFIVPSGATRLFLGTMDGYGWYNNSGSFDVTTSAPPTTGANAWAYDWPLGGGSTQQTIEQPYTCRGDGPKVPGGCYSPDLNHTGIDLNPSSGQSGVPVYPAADGIVCQSVTNTDVNDKFGNAVYVKHADGRVTIYGHLANPPPLQVNDPVYRNNSSHGDTVLGITGGSGSGDPDIYDVHLHFEIRNSCALRTFARGYSSHHPSTFGMVDPWSVLEPLPGGDTPIRIVSSVPGIYSAPGLSYPALGTLANDQFYIATAKVDDPGGDGDWYQIHIPCWGHGTVNQDGTCFGWVVGKSSFADYSVVDLSEVTLRVAGVGSTGLPVQSAPDNTSTALSEVWDGQLFVTKVLPQAGPGCTKGWYEISIPTNNTLGASTGWLCGNSLVPNACLPIQQSSQGSIQAASAVTGLTATSSASSTSGCAPINDDYANASTLPGVTGSLNADNTDATSELYEPDHANNIGGKSIWWSWVASADGTLNVDTYGSTFDTILAVYTGSNIWNLNAIAFNDNDGSPNNNSSVSFGVISGTEYKIAVDGYNGNAGGVVVNWSAVSTPPTVTHNVDHNIVGLYSGDITNVSATYSVTQQSTTNTCTIGVQSCGFSYRISGQSSADSLIFSLADSINLAGPLTFDYVTSGAQAFDISVDVIYKGVTAVDATGFLVNPAGPAVAEPLVVASTGLGGLGATLNGASVPNGNITSYQLIDSNYSNIVSNVPAGPGSLTLDMNLSCASNASNGGECIASIGQNSTLPTFAVNIPVNPGDPSYGIFVDLTFTPLAAPDQLPPLLTINSPANNTPINNSNVILNGTASDAGQGDNGISSVTVNTIAATNGTASGSNIANWSYSATLVPGVNNMSVIATDGSPNTNQTTDVLALTYIPFTLDTDGDGLDDSFETAIGTNPNLIDTDGDGRSDSQELGYDGDDSFFNQNTDTDPTNSDTDGDGFSDGEELTAGADPLDPASHPLPNGDVNGDGLVDVADLLLAMKILNDQYTPTLAEQNRWDVAPLVNGVPQPDGQNTLGDYLVLQRKVTGQIIF